MARRRAGLYVIWEDEKSTPSPIPEFSRLRKMSWLTFFLSVVAVQVAAVVVAAAVAACLSVPMWFCLRDRIRL
jgi:hypothetical protein